MVLFAVSAFIAVGVQAILAFNSAAGGQVVGHLLLGLADLAAAVIALAWPGATARVLVLIVGCWAVFVGVFGVFVALRASELARSRALFILGGLGAVAFGVSLFARPAMGAVARRGGHRRAGPDGIFDRRGRVGRSRCSGRRRRAPPRSRLR